jgi:hypothetical protein
MIILKFVKVLLYCLPRHTKVTFRAYRLALSQARLAALHSSWTSDCVSPACAVFRVGSRNMMRSIFTQCAARLL